MPSIFDREDRDGGRGGDRYDRDSDRRDRYRDSDRRGGDRYDRGGDRYDRSDRRGGDRYDRDDRRGGDRRGGDRGGRWERGGSSRGSHFSERRRGRGRDRRDLYGRHHVGKDRFGDDDDAPPTATKKSIFAREDREGEETTRKEPERERREPKDGERKSIWGDDDRDRRRPMGDSFRHRRFGGGYGGGRGRGRGGRGRGRPKSFDICKECKSECYKPEFSKSQWDNKNRGERRCMECVNKDEKVLLARGEISNLHKPDGDESGALCMVCNQKKGKDEFTKSQWSRNLGQRKCKDCCPNTCVPNIAGPGNTICSACNVVKPKSEFSAKQLKAPMHTRKCNVCIGAGWGNNNGWGDDTYEAPEPAELSEDQKKQNIFLENTKLDKEALEELTTITGQSLTYFQGCAESVETISFEEISNVFLCVEKIFKQVLATRGLPVVKQTFKEVVLLLRKCRLLKEEHLTSYSNIIELAAENIPKLQEANQEFAVADKKVLLETCYTILNYVQDELIPLVGETKDIFGIPKASSFNLDAPSTFNFATTFSAPGVGFSFGNSSSEFNFNSPAKSANSFNFGGSSEVNKITFNSPPAFASSTGGMGSAFGSQPTPGSAFASPSKTTETSQISFKSPPAFAVEPTTTGSAFASQPAASPFTMQPTGTSSAFGSQPAATSSPFGSQPAASSPFSSQPTAASADTNANPITFLNPPAFAVTEPAKPSEPTMKLEEPIPNDNYVPTTDAADDDAVQVIVNDPNTNTLNFDTVTQKPTPGAFNFSAPSTNFSNNPSSSLSFDINDDSAKSAFGASNTGSPFSFGASNSSPTSAFSATATAKPNISMGSAI